MQDDTGEMLRGTGADPRLTVDRSGNPLEQVFAVINKELTEPELHQMLRTAGVDIRTFTQLSKEMVPIVASGLYRIWKIGRLGGLIEGADSQTLGNTEGLSNVSKEVGYSRGLVGNWSETATSQLMQAATAQSTADRNRSCIQASGATQSYVDFLTNSRAIYQHGIQFSLPNGEQRDQALGYLGQREEKVGEMRQIYRQFNDQDISALIRIPVVPQPPTPASPPVIK